MRELADSFPPCIEYNPDVCMYPHHAPKYQDPFLPFSFQLLSNDLERLQHHLSKNSELRQRIRRRGQLEQRLSHILQRYPHRRRRIHNHPKS